MPISVGTPLEEPATRRVGERLALVIGNRRYQSPLGSLRNPGNDALRVAALLKRLGFEVTCQFDLTLAQMEAVIEEFTAASRHCKTALLYYAGHGMQAGESNMLVPVDFQYPRHEDMAALATAALKGSVSLDLIKDKTRQAPRTLIFLDACREFPTRLVDEGAPEALRSLLSRGFVIREKERDNLVVSYAADAGWQALDGEGYNSPYTAAFAELAALPISIAVLLQRMRELVHRATSSRQRPREINTLIEDYSLSDGQAVSATAPPQAPEDRMFGDVAVLDTPEAYRYYLAEHPDSRHNGKAQAALARIVGGGAGLARVKVEAAIMQTPAEPWFSPGKGREEWFQDLAVGPEMVVIPPVAAIPAHGTAESLPEAAVFAVSRTPVTFDQWAAASASGGVAHVASKHSSDHGRYPVVGVSWRDAQSYVAWLSRVTGHQYRLLTVAEWEHCARADDAGASIGTTASAGKSPPQAPAKFTLFQRPRSGHAEAGRDPPNGNGIHDMLGNVWEWCADHGSDPKMRAAKGGHPAGSDAAAAIAVTESYHENYGEPYIGFRVARVIKP